MILRRSLSSAAAAMVLGATASANPAGYNRALPGKHRVSAVPAAIGTIYSAVVDAKGKLVRGVGAVGAGHSEDGKGTYIVDFVTDVTGCAYVVTVGQVASSGSQPGTGATVVGASGDAPGVYVSTFNPAGARSNAPFHIDVAC